MNLTQLIWMFLLFIAVIDLRDNKIPNVLLILILTASTFEKAAQSNAYSLIGWSVIACAISFLGALCFFFLKVMAPGDVKLIGVIGYWLGWGNLLSAYFWIAIASVVVGVGVIAYKHRVRRKILLKEGVGESASHASIENMTPSAVTLKMPYAPVITLGLLLFYSVGSL